MGFCFALIASTYGWTHQEILKLSARQFFMYVEQIPQLLARQQLSSLEAASFPYMNETGRKEILDHYQDILEKKEKKYVPNNIEINNNWDLLRRGLIPHEH